MTEPSFTRRRLERIVESALREAGIKSLQAEQAAPRPKAIVEKFNKDVSQAVRIKRKPKA